MIKASSVRKVFNECKKKGIPFKSVLRENLGIVVKDYPDGRFPAKIDRSKQQWGTDEFSVRELYEEFVGPAYLKEDASPVLPSQFSDISAFNMSVGGLVERHLLAGYESPDFISDNFVTVQRTSQNGGKLIGLPRVKVPYDYTSFGEEMPTASLQERWALAQPNKKLAHKLALAKESVIYDLTGELLSSAEGVGYALRLGRETMIACAVMGINLAANTSNMLPPGFNGQQNYWYDAAISDTAANVYQNAAGTGATAKYNYINSLPSTSLVDWQTYQTIQGQLNLQREYETTYPILAKMDATLVSPQKEYQVRNIVHATQVIPVSNGGTTNFPTNFTSAANPIPTMQVFSSTIFNKLLVDVGFTQSNADSLIYTGDFKKAFIWREVWPLNVVQVNPLSSNLAEREIVNEWTCSWCGVPGVADPRYVIVIGANPNSPS